MDFPLDGWIQLLHFGFYKNSIAFRNRLIYTILRQVFTSYSRKDSGVYKVVGSLKKDLANLLKNLYHHLLFQEF